MSATAPESKFAVIWLPPEHYGLVLPQFNEWGRPLPDPAESSIAVVIDNSGEKPAIVGFAVLQRVIHAEPWFIAEEYRGSDVWRLLAEKVQEPFKQVEGSGFYVFAPNQQIAAMAEKCEMVEMPWKVYEKRF